MSLQNSISFVTGLYELMKNHGVVFSFDEYNYCDFLLLGEHGLEVEASWEGDGPWIVKFSQTDRRLLGGIVGEYLMREVVDKEEIFIPEGIDYDAEGLAMMTLAEIVYRIEDGGYRGWFLEVTARNESIGRNELRYIPVKEEVVMDMIAQSEQK